MAVISYIDAVTMAIREEMERDPKVFVLGEDVGVKGGVFKATTAQYPRDQVRIGLGMALSKLWGAKVVPKEVPIDVKLQTKENAKGFSW